MTIRTYAVVDLSMGNINCVKPAGTSFEITNKGDEDISVGMINIESNFLSSFGINEDIKGVDQNYKFNVNGKFKSDVINKNGGKVEFSSDNNIYNYPGKYKITLKYENCKKEYRKCEDVGEVSCPGVIPYGCSAIPIDIISCENYDNEFRLNFHNIKNGLLMDVNIYKDVNYVLYGNKKHIENYLPDGNKIDSLGNDTYIMTFPLNGNFIGRVKIESKICGSVDYADCKSSGAGNVSISDYKKIIRNFSNDTNMTKFFKESKNYSAVYILSVFVVLVILLILYNIRKVRI